MVGKSPGAPDTEPLQLLSRVRWLSDTGRATLAAAGRLMKYRARQSIYVEHGVADRVLFLLAGIAKIYYSHREQRTLIAHVAPGDIFGVTGLIPNETRRYSSEAISDCVVMSIEPEVFSEVVFGSSFELVGPALANTIGRWFELTARYTQFVRLGTRGRLALSLLEMSRKFGVRDARGVLLPLTISHAELGSMVGASRQHITMQLREFEREGLIVRDGRRLILKPERLETELEG
jgi:CRP/FNR family cyclic AMP-dependent transcriptional regulator